MRLQFASRMFALTMAVCAVNPLAIGSEMTVDLNNRGAALKKGGLGTLLESRQLQAVRLRISSTIRSCTSPHRRAKQL